MWVNVQFVYGKAGGTYTYHCTLWGLNTEELDQRMTTEELRQSNKRLKSEDSLLAMQRHDRLS